MGTKLIKIQTSKAHEKKDNFRAQTLNPTNARS